MTKIEKKTNESKKIRRAKIYRLSPRGFVNECIYLRVTDELTDYYVSELSKIVTNSMCNAKFWRSTLAEARQYGGADDCYYRDGQIMVRRCTYYQQYETFPLKDIDYYGRVIETAEALREGHTVL